MVTRGGTRSVEDAIEITAAGIESLRGTFHGELLLPEDNGYESTRRVWNAT